MAMAMAMATHLFQHQISLLQKLKNMYDKLSQVRYQLLEQKTVKGTTLTDALDFPSSSERLASLLRK